MNCNQFYPIPDPVNNQALTTDTPESGYSEPAHEYHIADGGEFIDGGLRMKDQPWCEIPLKSKQSS